MVAESPFLFFMLLSIQFLPVASKDTIAINQTLKDGDLLISKERNFALGFFSPGRSRHRYLGIWFNKVSEQTVVWVANRDSPIGGSSGTLSLDHRGHLVLYVDSDKKVPIWSAKGLEDATGGVCVAQLLDSGNLILVQDGSESKKILWQSFDYPTNTQITGMSLGLNRKTGRELFLTSWRSADDPGTGDYSFKFNTDGPPQYFLYKGADNYWRSCPWPWRNFASVHNHTYANNQDEVYITSYYNYVPGIQRVVIDESGLIQHLTWHETDGLWKDSWSAPQYWCDSYGNCGSFRKCKADNDKSLECACLPGYEPESPRDWLQRNGRGRCNRKREDSSMVCGQKGGFLKVPNVKVPAPSQAVWVNMNMSQVNCEQQCMKDFLCLAYASVNITGKESGCLAWFGQLMEIIDFVDDGYDLYVCLDALQLAEDPAKPNGTSQMKEMLAILVASVALAWIVIIVLVCLLMKRRKITVRNHWKRRFPKGRSLALFKDILAANKYREKENHPDVELFDLNTIYAATANFSLANKLGQGGFGSVYKGQLSDGQEIAVKRLSKSSGQGMEELTNEVMLIAKLQHRNLVKLLGCCIEGEEAMLIYEYLPNKSLDLFLFDQIRRSFLDWRQRFDIIVGIARGILYLHQDSRLRIIHRDLKSSNILLDAEMNPKISDFGMARIFTDDQIQDRTKRVVGTYGYMSPEYALFGKFSIKSDVFSFGVIVLEIVSGMKNNDFCQDDLGPSLTGYVSKLWRENSALEIVDSSVKESYVPKEALRCIQIGLLCVQEHSMDRPTMFDVVYMLNSDMPVPPPKHPAYNFHESNDGPNLPPTEGLCSINDLTISTVFSR